MKTLINGQDPTLAIAEEAKRQIKKANPAIDPDSYENPMDIPGFAEIMERPRGIGIDKTDARRYRKLRQKMNRTMKLRKNVIMDFRRYEDGRETVAALAEIKNRHGRPEKQLLWEEEIGWDVFIEC